MILQENVQKDAFEILLMQKDVRHSRVRNQIALIEKELTQISALEVEQRQQRTDTYMVVKTFVIIQNII